MVCRRPYVKFESINLYVSVGHPHTEGIIRHVDVEYRAEQNKEL